MIIHNLNINGVIPNDTNIKSDKELISELLQRNRNLRRALNTLIEIASKEYYTDIELQRALDLSRKILGE